MKQQVSNALGKLTGHLGEPLPKLASRAFSYARETALAAIGLRACDVVGAGARCIGLPVVQNEGRIELGKDVKVDCRWSPVEIAVGRGGELVIGDGAYINHGALISARKRVSLGRGAMIGNYSIVADCEAPGIGACPGEEPKAIEIGDGAWIAARVTVLPGARIGAGAVITAGSIVSGDIPAGVVAGGIPARVLRAAGATAKAGGSPTNKSNGAEHPPTLHSAAVPRPVKHRGTLISDFTIDDLSRQLESLPGDEGMQATIAPFGQVVQSLMSAPADGAAGFAVVWTRSESALPSLARSVAFEPAGLETLQGEVDAFCELLVDAARHYRSVFVPTWTMPPYERGWGMLDAREGGVVRALAVANLRLMENLAKSSNVYVLDAQRWVAAAGKNACNPKLWYLGKVAFHSDVFAEAARDIQAALTASTGGARKLLILDLDDTLWGGIVGDAGWENIRLGGHDGEGEAFVDFQHALKNLTRRGVVLGIVSKNEASVALEAIRRHPEMVLRESDFVAHRINWADKAHNILELAAELNLGLQSVVFIDDNPAERARVREALPEVFVPEWPEDKHLYRSTLATLRCFDSPAVSEEDAARTSLYAAERKREQLQASVGSIDEWLLRLGLNVRVEPLGQANLTRTTQLLNKTNQMNLSTRRLTESELSGWAEGSGRSLWAVQVEDRFGDAGLTGIVSVEVSQTVATIVDFVLSCRVMGRKIEQAMVHVAVEHARGMGADRVEADLVPTAKNAPCLTFWQASGFRRDGEVRFTWDAANPYPLPAAVALKWVR